MTNPLIFDAAQLARNRGRVKLAQHRFLYDEAVHEILERLALINRPFLNIAEIGGWDYSLLEQLAAQNPQRRIIKAHLNGHAAAHPAFPSCLTDGEILPFADGSLDLIISTLALHRTNDVPGVLTQMRRALKPDGLLMAVFFGGDTLPELRDCFYDAEQEIRGGVAPHIHPLIDMAAAGQLMSRAGFTLPVIDRHRLTLSYRGMFHLLHELRFMGEGNALVMRERKFCSRRFFMRAAELYTQRYPDGEGGILASFDLVFLAGWAPDSSQQQPLKPGSAAQKLADALKTKEINAGETVGWRKG